MNKKAKPADSEIDHLSTFSAYIIHTYKLVVARRSLTARVLFFVSIWTLCAFAAVTFLITNLYRESSERAFDELLQAHLNTALEAVELSDLGRLQGRPQFGDLRFSQPGSGWVWVIDPLEDLIKQSTRLTSSSIGNEFLSVPPVSEIAFDQQYLRSYQVSDRFDNQIMMFETEIELGETGQAVRVRVGGNLNILERDVLSFNQSLMSALIIAGLGTILINVIAILFGLKPLDHVRYALEQIRNGNADRLTGEFAREIEPLAQEVNALLDGNQRIVERSRMQVGNLAHALKTPIAVLLNETRQLPEDQARLFKAQAHAMQNQVRSYLDRARVSAQRGSLLARTDMIECSERLIRVMEKLNPQLEFSLNISGEPDLIAVEAQDFEEIMGNLLENASRFADGQVVMDVLFESDKSDVIVRIKDDGPGLDDHQKQRAMERGTRLDESEPGSGLGLSIVKEITQEYHGRFTLQDADIGGLSAIIHLPKVNLSS